MPRKRRLRWSVVVGVGLLVVAGGIFVPRLRADMVITDTDTQYEGDVVSDDKNMIIMQTDRGLMYFRRDKLKGVMYAEFPKSSATVQEITGTAEYQRKGQDQWRGLVVNTKLRPGDKVRTGDNSKVFATVAGQAVMSVEANSEMTVTDVARNDDGDVRVRLDLDEGQLWNDVGTLQSAKSRYIVETPQASCGVRGTVYTVLTSGAEAQTTVATVEGAVAIVQKTEGAAEHTVGAGEQSRFAQTGDVPTAPIEAGFSSQWEAYASTFGRLRAQLRFENFWAQYGVTRQQGILITAGAGGLIVLLLGIVIVRVRRR